MPHCRRTAAVPLPPCCLAREPWVALAGAETLVTVPERKAASAASHRASDMGTALPVPVEEVLMSVLLAGNGGWHMLRVAQVRAPSAEVFENEARRFTSLCTRLHPTPSSMLMHVPTGLLRELLHSTAV